MTSFKEILSDGISPISPCRLWLPTNFRFGGEGQFNDFLDGLGPSQLVGRQALGSPLMGDIQLSLVDKRGSLEVEVIRARNLVAKPGVKVPPGKHLTPLWAPWFFDGVCCRQNTL